MSKRNRTAETGTRHSKKTSAPRKAGKRPRKSGNAYDLPAVPNAQSSDHAVRRERVLSETNINGIMFYEMVSEPIMPTEETVESSGEGEATAAVMPEQVPASTPIHEPWRERVEVQVPQALREAHGNKKYDYDRVADELIPRIIANPHLAITRPWEVLEDYRRAENLSCATATRKVTKLSGTTGHVAGDAVRRTADNAGHARASCKRAVGTRLARLARRARAHLKTSSHRIETVSAIDGWSSTSDAFTLAPSRAVPVSCGVSVVGCAARDGAQQKVAEDQAAARDDEGARPCLETCWVRRGLAALLHSNRFGNAAPRPPSRPPWGGQDGC